MIFIFSKKVKESYKMQFAGNEYIYLSKLKKEKIRKLKENDQKEAPLPLKPGKEEKIDKPSQEIKNNLENQDDSIDSDDAYISVDSNNFNIDLVNSNLNMQMNQMPAAPSITYKKAIDCNALVIKLYTLENEVENNLKKLYKCQKCNSYLNKYSNLIPSPEKDKYDWKCEFCFYENKDLVIEKDNLPKDEIVETCIIEPFSEETKREDDTSLIFCLDNSWSMLHKYDLDEEIKEKFNKVSKKKIRKEITRLEMVKISVEKIINSLLKESPKVKVGFVVFSDDIEVKGDCLSNIIKVKEKDLDKETKLISLGKENTNLIKAEIKKSYDKIIEYLKEITCGINTALGPAPLLSLSLLNKAKPGSRIFLCTDGESNRGLGVISHNKIESIEFYKKLGNMAKEKGIIISLIAFEDTNSSINILKNMVEISGGDIFRVNPKNILDEIKDFLENKAVASEVEVKINLNKCLTFRDEEKININNEDSSILRKLGNVTKEKEEYFEFKFDHAKKLAKIDEINFDEPQNLIFQAEITHKKKNGGKYIRVISKKLKVSGDKEKIHKQADFNIISTLQIQKSAKLAGKGDMMAAQAQIHLARNFLSHQAAYNRMNSQIYHQFNSNMNSFNNILSKNNMMNCQQMGKMGYDIRMNYQPTAMMGYNMRMNYQPMAMMGYDIRMNYQPISMMRYGMGMNYQPKGMGMNNTMGNNNMNNMGMMNNNLNMMNNTNIGMMNNNTNMRTNTIDMNNNNNNNTNIDDKLSPQIHSLSNISQNRQNVMFNRNNQK